MLKVMSTSCLKPYLAPVVFSVVGCASFTVWLGKIMELLVHHQDLKFPLKIPFLGDMEDFRALACILWYAVHIMVCSAYHGMHCIPTTDPFAVAKRISQTMTNMKLAK